MELRAQIEEMPFTSAVIIRSRCKIWGLPKVMKKSFFKLIGFMKENSFEMKYAPFSYYYNIDWNNLTTQSGIRMFLEMFTRIWYFHCGIPTVAEVTPRDEIEVIEYPYQKVATGIHNGPYHKVGATYKELYRWIKGQGLQAEPVSFEIYLNTPGEVKSDQLETKILIPLK